jgi:nucleoside-diphosphate-sugar epimerase
VHEREALTDTGLRVLQEVDMGDMEIVDPPAHQIHHKVMDCSKVESLGWRPGVSLEEGIRATVAHARTEAIRDYAGVT